MDVEGGGGAVIGERGLDNTGAGAVDGNQDGIGDAGNGEDSSRDQANGVRGEDVRGENVESDGLGRGMGSLVGVRNVGGRGGGRRGGQRGREGL